MKTTHVTSKLISQNIIEMSEEAMKAGKEEVFLFQILKM